MSVIKRFAMLVLLFAVDVHAAAGDDLYHQAVQILGGHESVVSRWHGEIRFVVIGAGADVAGYARSLMTDAGGVTGLPVAFPQHAMHSPREYLASVQRTPPMLLSAPCGDQARAPCFNFAVVFTDYRTMRALAQTIPIHPHIRHFVESHPDMPCLYAPFHTGRQVIWQALVLIRDDLDVAMQRTCLQEEVYQALGLFNDYTDSELFSFNNVVAPKHLTDYDKALLAALYDPRVQSGYPVNFVARIFMERMAGTGDAQ